jgi:hypothetical protein
MDISLCALIFQHILQLFVIVAEVTFLLKMQKTDAETTAIWHAIVRTSSYTYI